MSSERAAEALGEWIGTIENRVDDVEGELQTASRARESMREEAGDMAQMLNGLEEDLGTLEEKVENHKRAEFISSVVSTFDDNGAVITDFQLKDKDGAFLQGGGVELSIHAEAKDGDAR